MNAQLNAYSAIDMLGDADVPPINVRADSDLMRVIKRWQRKRHPDCGHRAPHIARPHFVKSLCPLCLGDQAQRTAGREALSCVNCHAAVERDTSRTVFYADGPSRVLVLNICVPCSVTELETVDVTAEIAAELGSDA